MPDEITTNDTNLPRDINEKEIQVANTIICQDADGTVNPSPLTLSTSPDEIVPPVGALTFNAVSTAIWLIGENATLDGSAAGKGYAAIPANTVISVPCADGASIYVRAASGTPALSFWFETLESA